MARRKRATKKAGRKRPAAAKGKSAAAENNSGRKTEGPGTRPLWSGVLRLALVSVPVRIYPATRSGARIAFHQVHQPSGKRVRYQKVVPGVGPVDADEIVKGYELDGGRYVLLEPEEIDALKLETQKTIDLVQFVSQGEIDPIWFDRPYYIVPDGELAEEAYGVLRDALRESRRLGLGQFVMRGREYVAAVKPCGKGLLLETLRFADEVREAAPFFADAAPGKADSELLGMAQELIERRTAPFDPDRFQDHYTEALKELIAARKREEPVEISEEEVPAKGGAQVIDLVEALKRSVKREERGGASGAGQKRRKAG